MTLVCLWVSDSCCLEMQDDLTPAIPFGQELSADWILFLAASAQRNGFALLRVTITFPVIFYWSKRLPLPKGPGSPYLDYVAAKSAPTHETENHPSCRRYSLDSKRFAVMAKRIFNEFQESRRMKEQGLLISTSKTWPKG